MKSFFKTFPAFLVTFAFSVLFIFSLNYLDNLNLRPESFSKQEAKSLIGSKVKDKCFTKQPDAVKSFEETEGTIRSYHYNRDSKEYHLVIDWNPSARGKTETVMPTKGVVSLCYPLVEN